MRVRAMAAGRPTERSEYKLHKGIRDRVRYTGKRTLVKLGSGVPEAARARKNRPKGTDGKMMSAAAWDAWWRKMLDDGEYTQCATAYGTLHQKPYRFWTSVKEWEPRDSKEWCRSCEKKEEHEQQVVPRKGSNRKRLRLEGYINEAARNRIPPELMAHWAEAAKVMIGL